MAQRRMTSLEVTDTDAFLDMPSSSQLLYFHLNSRADDDGFVANPKKVLRAIGGNDDDMKVLLLKRFIIAFEDGVCVIKHWRVNNFIRKDIYKPTQYLDLKRTLFIRPNGAYTMSDDGDAIPVPEGHFRLEDVNGALTQRQLSIGKDSVGKKDTVAIATDTPKNVKKIQESGTDVVTGPEPVKAAQFPDTPPKADSFFQKRKKERLDDGVSMSLKEFILMCRASQYRHIRLLAEHADDKEFDYSTRGQWREYGTRNMRVASRLAPFTDRQIQAAQWKLDKDLKENGGFISKWGMETLEKYLD
jgi:hypothetical protein